MDNMIENVMATLGITAWIIVGISLISIMMGALHPHKNHGHCYNGWKLDYETQRCYK